MTEINYTGLYDSSLQLIREQLKETEDRKYMELEENSTVPPLSADVLLIGEKVGNPIKIAQRVHALDKHLSIIIINDARNHQQIKQALLFTPFIGSSLQCIPNSLEKGLASSVQDSITRTRQRRNYARLQASPEIVRLNTHLYEDVKTEYLDKFLQEAPIGALLLNQEGLVMAINRHATLILACTEKEVLGKALSSLFPAGAQTALNSFILEGFKQLATQIFQRTTLHTQPQHLELRIAEISSKNRVHYKVGILADISGKVRNQQRIEQQLQALEQANNKLQRANTDLDTFVYTASHDLKAPIANIEGLVDLLKRKINPESEELAPIFNMIQLSMQRFQATIKDLSEVTHIQKEAEKETIVAIQEVVEEVKALLYEMIKSTDVRIETDFQSCSQIRFSRSNLRSIVYNLLSNAIKYHSPERQPLIRIKTKKTGEQVLLSVQDNGLGFSADKKGKIFTMFKRLHNHVEGTGIGLFIVKRIVDNTQGSLEVESEEGKGTTFNIYLKQTCPE